MSVLAIDAVGAKHGGAGSVLLAVIQAALRSPGLERVVLYGSPRRFRQFLLPADPRLHDTEIGIAERGPFGRILWNRFGLKRALCRDGAQAVLCLSGGGVVPPNLASATLIQQSLPFAPEALRTLSLAGRLRMTVIRNEMRLSIQSAGLCFVQTPTMARWLGEAFHLSTSQIAVVEPCPTDHPPRPTSASATGRMETAPHGRRVLYVGNSSPYKNVGVLPPAMRLLRASLPDAVLFATLPKEHLIPGDSGICGLPYLDPSSLRRAYELATVLVMPSLVETVGLPMLEAASYGVPIVAADRPYAHDVCGQAALYFDPHDSSALADTLRRVLLDQDLRTKIGQHGLALAAARKASSPYDRMIAMVLGARP